MDGLVIGVFLAVLNNRVLEWFVRPLFDRLNVDTLWLRYISGATGCVLTVLGGVRLLLPYNVDIGMYPDLIVSGLIVGGGANLIHEIFGGGNGEITELFTEVKPTGIGEPTDIPREF